MDQSMTTGCGCGNDVCATLPPEFVRVRYFYGQRLGVMELSDEAAYHAGKMAFHNARAHGVGVLCGLRAERMGPADKPSTVLRVTRGAALDACGREVIVGADQCIDLAAWFVKNRASPGLAGFTAGTTQPLYVALRYRECPSDPSPAPRDPCGCDSGGCENGRVREGFELQIVTQADVVAPGDVFPALATLEGALANAAGVVAAVDAAVAADCPAPPGDGWLYLASLEVKVGAGPALTDIVGAPDDGIPERRSLLSTSALQALMLDLAASSGAELGEGPRIESVQLVAGTPPELHLPVALLSDGTPPVVSSLVAATFDPASVKLEQMGPGGWGAVAVSASWDGANARFVVKLPATFGAGTYRLTLDPDFVAPPADDHGRALPRFARRLVAATDASGNLHLQ